MLKRLKGIFVYRIYDHVYMIRCFSHVETNLRILPVNETRIVKSFGMSASDEEPMKIKKKACKYDPVFIFTACDSAQ